MSTFDVPELPGSSERRLPVTGTLNLPPGEHLCLFYDDPAEQAPALVPFLKQGLDSGERVIYVADDSTTSVIRSWLIESGVDTDAAEGSGALRLWTRNEWLEPGELDSVRTAEHVQRLAREARDQGYPGVRLGIEMTWPDPGQAGAERRCLWDSTLNTIFEADLNARIICQYSTGRLHPEALHAALRAHPTAIIGADVCPNPYYDAPIILRGGSDRERADWTAARIQHNREEMEARDRQMRDDAAEDETVGNRSQFNELYRLADEASERLRVASAAKDEFLALISHELRTPLTMILGNAEVLHRQGGSLDDEERASAVEDLHVEARRLSSIVEHLLIVSRVEDTGAIEAEPILPLRVLDPLADRYREIGRTVAVDGGDGLAAWGSRKVVGEVLENLLQNAHQYSAIEHPIEVDVRAVEGECIIRVSDRGIGLLDDEIDHVFEPFYRSPRVSATQVRGLGVGLAACRRLLEAHRGRIWAEQRPGGGSTFSFALPLAELNA